MSFKRSLIGFAAALFLVIALGRMSVKAQNQEGMTLDEFMNVSLTLMIDILNRIERIEEILAETGQVTALETRVALLESEREQVESVAATETPATTPTLIAPPTMTPYQRLKSQQEEEAQDDMTLFLFRQDKDLVKNYVSAPQLIMGGFYIVEVAPMIRLMVNRCDVTFLDMTRLIDQEADDRIRQNGGEPIYEDGKPILIRKKVVVEWVDAKANGEPFCP